MIDLYVEKGFSKEDASKIIELMATNKTFFIDHMLVEELGMLPPDDDLKGILMNSLVMFTAFVIFGLVPLLAYLAFRWEHFWLFPAIVAYLRGSRGYLRNVRSWSLSMCGNELWAIKMLSCDSTHLITVWTGLYNHGWLTELQDMLAHHVMSEVKLSNQCSVLNIHLTIPTVLRLAHAAHFWARDRCLPSRVPSPQWLSLDLAPFPASKACSHCHELHVAMILNCMQIRNWCGRFIYFMVCPLS